MSETIQTYNQRKKKMTFLHTVWKQEIWANAHETRESL